MALTNSKRLYLILRKESMKNVLLSQGSKIQYLTPVLYYCNPPERYTTENNISRSRRFYKEQLAKADELLKQQIQEFELGKEFLANMMGDKSKKMTQKDIDNAIEYLFPSGLFVPKARPLMKPPQELLLKQKKAEFDEDGRPYHCFFYTLKPNFSQCLHDAAETLQKLNDILYKKKKCNKTLSLVGGRWLSQSELGEKFGEKIFDVEYEKFLEVFTALQKHPFAIEAEDFLKSYWKIVESKTQVLVTPKVETKDNITVSVVEGTRRKTSTAKVAVSSPGSGKIRINNMGIDYFTIIGPREQVSVNLIFSKPNTKMSEPDCF